MLHARRRKDAEVTSGYTASENDALRQSKRKQMPLPQSKTGAQASEDASWIGSAGRAGDSSSSWHSARDAGLMPWGIVHKKKKTDRFEASFRLPKELLRARTSVRSGDEDITVHAIRRVRLGRVDALEHALAMQTEFIDGLDDQNLAQELRR